MSKNPFLNIAYPLNWEELTVDKIPAALEEALTLASANLKALETLPLESLTYEKLMGGIESFSRPLDEAWGLTQHITGVSDSPEIRKVMEDYIPKISSFYALIGVNAALWERLQKFAKSATAKKLSALEKRHLELALLGFRLAGANLKPDQKKEYVEIEQALAKNCEAYTKAVLDATNAFERYFPIGAEKDILKGLPVSALESAATEAKTKGKEGYRFTLKGPSFVAIVTYADNAELRKEFTQAAQQIGRQAPNDTLEFVKNILALRQRKANLLGFKNFSELATQTRMLNSPSKISSFLKKLTDKTKAPMIKEFQRLASLKKERGDASPFEPWDRAYYGEKLSQKELLLEAEKHRPYFEFNRVLESLFTLTSRLYGITYRKVPEHKSWHKEAEFYEVSNAQGKLLGGFYTDFFPRESKRAGAWESELIRSHPLANGKLSPKVATICGNFSPPTSESPPLLTHDEVETLYHEFGHLMHAMLSTVNIPSMSGTTTALDFIELPSQLMENYCYNTDYLSNLARHYKTGEALPSEEIAKIKASKKFLLSLFINRQLNLGAIDMFLHTVTKIPTDIDAAIEKALHEYRLPYQTQPPAIYRNFSHLFAGADSYASGYYSYQWSNVLEADAWTRFEHEGIESPKVGASFRDEILSRGNSEPAEKLFKNFVGRAPKLDAYLKRLKE